MALAIMLQMKRKQTKMFITLSSDSIAATTIKIAQFEKIAFCSYTHLPSSNRLHSKPSLTSPPVRHPKSLTSPLVQ